MTVALDQNATLSNLLQRRQALAKAEAALHARETSAPGGVPGGQRALEQLIVELRAHAARCRDDAAYALEEHRMAVMLADLAAQRQRAEQDSKRAEQDAARAEVIAKQQTTAMTLAEQNTKASEVNAAAAKTIAHLTWAIVGVGVVQTIALVVQTWVALKHR